MFKLHIFLRLYTELLYFSSENFIIFHIDVGDNCNSDEECPPHSHIQNRIDTWRWSKSAALHEYGKWYKIKVSPKDDYYPPRWLLFVPWKENRETQKQQFCSVGEDYHGFINLFYQLERTKYPMILASRILVRPKIFVQSTYEIRFTKKQHRTLRRAIYKKQGIVCKYFLKKWAGLRSWELYSDVYKLWGRNLFE